MTFEKLKELYCTEFRTVERLEKAISYSNDCIAVISTNPKEGWEDTVLLHNCAKAMFTELLIDLKKRKD